MALFSIELLDYLYDVSIVIMDDNKPEWRRYKVFTRRDRRGSITNLQYQIK